MYWTRKQIIQPHLRTQRASGTVLYSYFSFSVIFHGSLLRPTFFSSLYFGFSIRVYSSTPESDPVIPCPNLICVNSGASTRSVHSFFTLQFSLRAHFFRVVFLFSSIPQPNVNVKVVPSESGFGISASHTQWWKIRANYKTDHAVNSPTNGGKEMVRYNTGHFNKHARYKKDKRSKRIDWKH